MEKLTADDAFGNYRVIRVLGEGGFATVYLAEDVRPAMSRQVALKVLDDRFADDQDCATGEDGLVRGRGARPSTGNGTHTGATSTSTSAPAATRAGAILVRQRRG